MARPYAIIVGAMKCGTTSLTRYLEEHPQVCSCEQDEPNFFVDDEVYRRGFSWYESLFGYDPTRHRICVENSGNYTKHPTFPTPVQRIRDHLQDPKFIYIVRDPVDRVESHFNFSLQNGWIERGFSPTDERFLVPSRYAKQMEIFESAFPRESILVVKLEDLARTPAKLLARVQEFLGLDPRPFQSANERHNVTRSLTRAEYLSWRLGLGHLKRTAHPRLWRAAERVLRPGLGKKVQLTPTERVEVASRLEADALAVVDRYGVDPRGKNWPLPRT